MIEQRNISRLHSWQVDASGAILIQLKLRKKIQLKRKEGKIEKIAAIDVAYEKEKAVAGVLVFSYPQLNLIEKVSTVSSVDFPYIPGLLTFREGPCIIDALCKVKEKADLLLFDGQGIAHPRRMGIATHLGIYLNISSIGCAKSKLTGDYNNLADEAGAFAPLYDGNELVGFAVRTKKDTRPVFVSPGNLIDFDQALKIVLTCCRGHRIPEPLRLAHIFANSEKQRVRENGKNQKDCFSLFRWT